MQGMGGERKGEGIIWVFLGGWIGATKRVGSGIKYLD